MRFISEFKKRNPVLYWYGVLNFVAAVICIILSQTTDVSVNGVNAFIKPFKFYVSIGIFCWTMGWIMHYLQSPSKVTAYNLMVIIVFTFESYVITWQAANGRLSHFNNSSTFYGLLFTLMGVAIVTLTLWTGYIGYLFFKKRNWQLPMPYVGGIRLGIFSFVLFALEGGIMASALRHTVGGNDGGSGVAVVNWSREHGDLRIAHFFGMHTLQLFPMFGYYLAASSKSVIIFVSIYVALVVAVLVRALMGLPLL